MEIFTIIIIVLIALFAIIYFSRDKDTTSNSTSTQNQTEQASKENEKSLLKEQETKNKNFVSRVATSFRNCGYIVNQYDNIGSVGIDMILKTKKNETIGVRCIYTHRAEPRDVKLLRTVIDNQGFDFGIIVYDGLFDDSVFEEILNNTDIKIRLLTFRDLSEQALSNALWI